ncbi:MAG: proline dehydrogenase family protein, partial [Acidimicrobiia bacterium]
LGENLADPADIDAVVDDYVAAYDAIGSADVDTEVSVKLTQLGLDLDPELTTKAVMRLAAAGEAQGNWLWIDMESSPYVDRTLEIYRKVRSEHDKVGICLQAYLHRTPDDIAALAPLRPGIRLVKGAYKEPSSVAVTKRPEIDEAFVQTGLDLLARTADGVRLALASHDVGLLNRLEAADRSRAGGPGTFEVHMLYGIRMADQQRYADSGYRVRTLISYGPEWYPWYVRRLAERPANLGFVLRNLFART